MAKFEGTKGSSSPKTGRVGRDASSGKFVEQASKWASANSVTRDAARAKLHELGIHDNRGKLGKDYK
ncbi:hypothetical protein [Hyphomicrobium sp.]|jgi:hypothetical protein|uniref:hypothetical protein n=1 Tax=Hyphomicrobium sp. TaxID=82 RepID=UPI003568E323